MITIRYIDTIGRLVFFVLEKIIELTNVMTDGAMSAFKYEIATKMRECIFEKKNYEVGMAMIKEYQEMKLELSHENTDFFTNITEYFYGVLDELKNDDFVGEEEEIKDFIDGLISKDTKSNHLRDGE